MYMEITLHFGIYANITDTIWLCPAYHYKGLGANVKSIYGKAYTNTEKWPRNVSRIITFLYHGYSSITFMPISD